MILSMVLAATKPWTHWIAPPLLAAEVLYLVALAVRYYRRIQVPHYLWTLRQQQQQQQQQQQRARYSSSASLQPGASAGLSGEEREPSLARAA